MRSQDSEKERGDRRERKGTQSTVALTYPGHALPTRTSRAQREFEKPSAPPLNPEGYHLYHSHCQDDEEGELSSLDLVQPMVQALRVGAKEVP